MPELRKDPVTGHWVVFSSVRAQRQAARGNASRSTDRDACPFCPGHESLTPPEVFAYRDHGPPNSPGWRVRCIPNAFPALEREAEAPAPSTPPFESLPGVGVHDVIVETPEHDRAFAQLTPAEIEAVLAAYRQRAIEVERDHRIRYVLVMKNSGEAAGASVSHPHSQLLALPLVPHGVQEELDGLRRFGEANRGACAFCEILRHEQAERRRLVTEDDAFVALSPFAPRFPFETWIVPKDHAASFEHGTEATLPALAHILRDVLQRYHVALQDPPFNFYIHTAPRGTPAAEYHWHIEVTPRLSGIAAFEIATGIFINPVIPEDATAVLRGEVGIPRKSS